LSLLFFSLPPINKRERTKKNKIAILWYTLSTIKYLCKHYLDILNCKEIEFVTLWVTQILNLRSSEKMQNFRSKVKEIEPLKRVWMKRVYTLEMIIPLSHTHTHTNIYLYPPYFYCHFNCVLGGVWSCSVWAYLTHSLKQLGACIIF
jgi:hypothetical protein